MTIFWFFGIHQALYTEDIVVEIHMVFRHFLFVLGCSWVIFPHRFGRYLLGKHICCVLPTQHEDTRKTAHSMSKAIEALDMSSKNGWISNIKFCLWLFSLPVYSFSLYALFIIRFLSWIFCKNLAMCIYRRGRMYFHFLKNIGMKLIQNVHFIFVSLLSLISL
jgi:hypothetical protein